MPHERLSADKIGEELAPDAGIWQTHRDKAKEHSDEPADNISKNLVLMLFFVSSAVFRILLCRG